MNKQEQAVTEQQQPQSQRSKSRIKRAGGFFYRNFFNVGAWAGTGEIRGGFSYIQDSFRRVINAFLGEERRMRNAQALPPSYSKQELLHLKKGYIINLAVLGLCAVISLLYVGTLLLAGNIIVSLLALLLVIVIAAYSVKLYLLIKASNQRLKRLVTIHNDNRVTAKEGK